MRPDYDAHLYSSWERHLDLCEGPVCPACGDRCGGECADYPSWVQARDDFEDMRFEEQRERMAGMLDDD